MIEFICDVLAIVFSVSLNVIIILYNYLLISVLVKNHNLHNSRKSQSKQTGMQKNSQPSSDLSPLANMQSRHKPWKSHQLGSGIPYVFNRYLNSTDILWLTNSLIPFTLSHQGAARRLSLQSRESQYTQTPKLNTEKHPSPVVTEALANMQLVYLHALAM